MLIDSGYFNDGGEYVIQYLEKLGIDRLDYLVTSHPDADRTGGHADVIPASDHLDVHPTRYPSGAGRWLDYLAVFFL